LWLLESSFENPLERWFERYCSIYFENTFCGHSFV
jgi:hypothetical protein